MRVVGENTKPKKTASRRARNTGFREDSAVGSALRAVYQGAVEEKIPDEMLDLLGKLN